MTPDEIITLLGLEPHVEGGHYRRTYRHKDGPEGRGHATAIYYLLEGHEEARWHRTDGDELWHWYAGAPLTLETATENGRLNTHVLGNDLRAGQRPQILVPGNAWQRAVSMGDWTLCGCTVAPGFTFDHYELAPDGWAPGAR